MEKEKFHYGKKEAFQDARDILKGLVIGLLVVLISHRLGWA